MRTHTSDTVTRMKAKNLGGGGRGVYTKADLLTALPFNLLARLISTSHCLCRA